MNPVLLYLLIGLVIAGLLALNEPPGAFRSGELPVWVEVGLFAACVAACWPLVVGYVAWLKLVKRD